MNNKFFIPCFFLLLIIAVSNSYAQPAIEADSLINCLKTAKDDTTKTKILNSLSTYYLRNNPSKSLAYANECLALASKLNFKESIISSYTNIAGYYYYSGNTKLAEEYSLKAIPLIQQTGNKESLCSLYDNLSSLAANDANYAKSIDYSDKALNIAGQINDSAMMAKVLGNRANIYMIVSDYSSAMKCVMQALTLNEKRNNKARMAVNYRTMGCIYLLENNTDKALANYELALKASKESNDLFQESNSLEQIGEIYKERKEFTIARSYFQQSLDISQQIGSLSFEASCYESLAIMLKDEGKTDSAISYASKALLIAEKTNDKVKIGDGYNTMGLIYMQKKEYDKAISYLLKCLAIAKEIGQKNNASIALHSLAQSYDALNDYKSSGAYWQQYAFLNDTILNEESIKKMSEMEAKYNLAGKEKEIALLTTEKNYQKQKISLLKEIFIGGLLLVTLLFFFAYRSYRTRQLLKLQTLRNKIAIDLHDDIGSTLSSISMFSLMARQESKEVIPMLDQIGEYSRKMLDSMADIVWTINPENDNFEKIILRMRSFAFELLGAKNIDFEFNTDESITDLKLSMDVRKNLYLIFKEATNNMVKYAGANSALFSITGSKNNLTLLIRDNGKGFDLNHTTQGNGLKNMKNRALEIGARFLIESEPGKGTTIQLLIKTA